MNLVPLWMLEGQASPCKHPAKLGAAHGTWASTRCKPSRWNRRLLALSRRDQDASPHVLRALQGMQGRDLRQGGRALQRLQCCREGRELPCAPPNPLPAWTLRLLSLLIGKAYITKVCYYGLCSVRTSKYHCKPLSENGDSSLSNIDSQIILEHTNGLHAVSIDKHYIFKAL
ncbi:hypothetical protein M441DRAFT_51063 [Trichoderma asperellum CBS 433.97]|uniref:Uncharacterized protein n=1 Tax=Trichoderma asperellum (strain ATCC 204424 / CBS 433.97 / NBRC 101777) TaxID=1042311 RepID=A0A2T3YUT6_TRIA4|nr:hypothetical protein M441DRAFT_51063 [Trichoderma asperellum CBS 433.97]PTB36315.1 hypothetical protein M441DRAFT_51063 [Trichoderma asperellum CBS 433.97]